MRLSRALWLLSFAVMAIFLAPLSADAAIEDMLEMSEQMDQLERQDFQAAISQANACTRERNFSCTDLQLDTAAKLAGGSSDQKVLAGARQKLSNEKWQVAEEARLRAEEERRRAEQERIALEEQRRQAEAKKAGGFQWGKLAAIGVGAAIGGLGNLPAEQQTEFITSAVKDSASGQEGVSNMQSTTDRLSAEQSQRQAMIAQQERQRQANAVAAEAANNERLLKAAKDSRQPNGAQTAVSQSAGTPVQQRNMEPPLYAEAAQLRSEPARALGPTYSGAPCGPGIRCTLGMSGQRHCEPSIPPTGAHCEEGCTIRGWGATYHDVTLPSDKVYIPMAKLCEERCTVLNLCSGN